MNLTDRVAVCSRSFSKNITLRNELLCKYKHVTFNETGLQLDGDDLISFLSGHTKAIIGLEKITNEVLLALPELEVISKYGVGLDMVDLSAVNRLGKTLGWTGGVNKRSVSEMVIAFSVSILRHFPAANKEVLAGAWNQHIGGLLSGRTVGIVGCGHIGKDLVKLLQPWGCHILINDVLDLSEFCSVHNVSQVSLDSLLSQSDVVSLHIPLNESTRTIIGMREMKRMKHGAVLINTARGGLVDENALKECLSLGVIAAAAFDVFEVEPPVDQKLLRLPNFFATPHLGGSAQEAILAMGRAAIASLEKVRT